MYHCGVCIGICECKSRFRHPAPIPLKGSLKTKTSLLSSSKNELVELDGVLLTGREIGTPTTSWKFRLYECAVKGVALRRSIFVVSPKQKIRLIFSQQADYEKWLEQLMIAAEWRLQNYYKLEAEIGKGKYSTVYSATERSTGQRFAVKIVWKSTQDPKALTFIERERKILHFVDHEVIIRPFDVFDEPTRLCIVLEYMNGGMLSDVLRNVRVFSEKDISDLMRTVFQGLQYLHKVNIVHRDIKPDNILCSDSSFPLKIKIADFGLSNFLQEKNGQWCLTSGVGTPYYVAPEMVMKKEYGCSVDMWSCGVLLFLLLTGRFPFRAHSKSTTLEKIREGRANFRPEDWNVISPEAKDLVNGLLQKDPSKRLVASEALLHPWIHGRGLSERKLSSSRLLVALEAIERGNDIAIANKPRKFYPATTPPRKARR